MRGSDMLVICTSGLIAHRIATGMWFVDPTHQLFLVLGLLLAIGFFNQLSLYRAWRGVTTIIEIRAVTGAWLGVIIALMVIYNFIVPDADRNAGSSVAWLTWWAVLGCVSLCLIRGSLRMFLRWIRSKGYNQRSVVIVGMSQRGLSISEQLRRANWTGLQVVGFFDERCAPRAEGNTDVRCLGQINDVAEYVQKQNVDQVWICLPLGAEERVRKVLHELRHSTVHIRYVLDIFSFDLCNHSINEVAGVPILNLSASPLTGANALIKNLEDRLLAALILLLISPLMIAIAIGVKRSSPGPIFYRQERVGWNNRSFTMFKFRSMPASAETQSGPVWAKVGENRATAFGAFLRRTSLDELPQFINVLFGHMSIVGPRPERPVFVEKFKNEIPSYMKKHMMKAGITGWAQVNGWRGNTDLKKRIECDLYYIEHWSLWLDVKIIFLTLFKGFIHKNAY